MRALRDVTLGLLLFVLACEQAPPTGREVELWRFAIEETPGSVQDAYAQRFKALVEERTQGRVHVIVYPYGTLGTSDHILEQLHNGTVQLATASPGHLGKLIPEVQAFLLHFVLSEDEERNERALASAPVRDMMQQLYAEKGLRFVSLFSEGWMAWTTREAVHTPEDFEGMKFRVMTSPLLIAAYSAYGASPTPLPYSQVYSGLQLRMIDGQVNPVFAIQEMSFYEVTNYLTFPRHAAFVTTVAATPRFYASMSPERQRMFDDIIEQLREEIVQVQRRFNRERLDIIRERKPDLHIVELSAEERQRFAERARPVRETYVQLAGERGARLLRVLDDAMQAP